MLNSGFDSCRPNHIYMSHFFPNLLSFSVKRHCYQDDEEGERWRCRWEKREECSEEILLRAWVCLCSIELLHSIPLGMGRCLQPFHSLNSQLSLSILIVITRFQPLSISPTFATCTNARILQWTDGWQAPFHHDPCVAAFSAPHFWKSVQDRTERGIVYTVQVEDSFEDLISLRRFPGRRTINNCEGKCEPPMRTFLGCFFNTR